MAKYTDAGDVDLDEEVVYDSKGRRIDEAYAEAAGEEAYRDPPGRHDRGDR